ncbi:MAG: hypothetical protein F4Y47_04880 [Acidobacteriia bacterium]|nr:hypothetical protein [Terriglobia bacterium]MYG01898.1 hypothetical protein [Terriglobia bacterium]MYK10739.1 hypothetical protein [Terriglobia bacterium]
MQSYTNMENCTASGARCGLSLHGVVALIFYLPGPEISDLDLPEVSHLRHFIERMHSRKR